MYQEIYIDVVFAANLLMDYLLLRLVGWFLRCRAGRRRCFAAAALGAFGSCLILCIPSENTPVLTVALHGFCALVMLRIGLKIQKGALLLKAFLMLYLTAFLCGGFVGSCFKRENTYDQSFSVMRVCGVHRQQCISFCSGLDPGGQTEYLSGDVWLSGQSTVGLRTL